MAFQHKVKEIGVGVIQSSPFKELEEFIQDPNIIPISVSAKGNDGYIVLYTQVAEAA